MSFICRKYADNMRVTDWLNRIFRYGSNVLRSNYGAFGFADYELSKEEFGRVIFVDICELLTNIINDVTFTLKGGKVEDFATFNAFVKMRGQYVLNRLFIDGYVVVGATALGLRVLEQNEYNKIGKGNVLKIEPTRADVTECYVIKSSIFELNGSSDYTFVKPFVKYLNNALNASNTALERLGYLVVGSPASQAGLPTIVNLTKTEKEELEKEIQEQYGALSKQKQIMLLPRQMSFQTINLASLDTRTSERVRLAILAICDRVKVPANQVAIIDANSSKALSNGSELREGDFNKYQSFERLLNQTFVRMAEDMGLRVDYEIYNKPDRNKLTNNTI